MPVSVCVITAAWNQVDKTLACLESVRAQDYPDLSVLLVDNGSTDGTAEQVQAHFPQVEVIRLAENQGPTGGYNAGFGRAMAQGFELIFLINNDTLLAPDCVSQLAAEAGRSAGVGLLMPKIYYASEPERIWSVGGWEKRWNLEVARPGAGRLDRGQWERPLDIDDVPFCAVMLRRGVLEQIGLPDEAYYLYYEDRDYSRRVQRAGFRLRLVPAAKVWHAVSASSGGSDSPNERYWMARSSILFFRQNVNRPLHWLIIVPWRLGSALRTSLRLLRGRRTDALKAYWRGLRDGLRGGAEAP
ncbi:MAG: glycosyltransferase family 2 protein [Candidatus Promineifilaceae bacterium]